MFDKLRTLAVTIALIASSFVITSSLQAMPGMGGSAKGNTVSGTVVETMDAGGYTYILVDEGTLKNWVAIPQTPVKSGAKVHYVEGMEMRNFTSKTLNRTFDTIIFSAGLSDTARPRQGAKAAAADDSFNAAVQAEKGAAKRQTAIQKMETSGGSAGAIVPFIEIEVDKAAGDNGYTVAEIFDNAEKLSGQKVRINGRIVKFSPMIMGRNWVHIQDGTGNPMNNSHDLVVTTAQQLKEGDIVTVEGILAAKKDFGAGYTYDAIVEQAVVVDQP